MTHKDFPQDLIYDRGPLTATQLPPHFQSQLNLDYSDSPTFLQTHSTYVVIDSPMGKQKTVTTGRKPGRPRGGAQGGGGGRGGPKGRSSQSATPAPGVVPDGATPKLKLKVNMRRDPSNPHPVATSIYGGNRDQDDDLPQQLAQPAPVTTRTGRTIHKPQQYDAVQGSEIDIFVDQNSEDQRDDNGCFLASDPPYVSHKAQERPQQLLKPGDYPHKSSLSFGAALGKIDEESPSSQTLQVQSPPADPSHFVADQDVYAVLNVLCSTTKTFLDLPGLSNASNPSRTQPYSAKTLTQLYILCYQEQRWDLCDMISDTWIRAFHDLRKKGQREPKYQSWRPNPALDRRKRKAQEAWAKGQSIPSEFDANPKDYGLVVTDPELDHNVTDINTDLLNTLYEYTSPKCGARFLWADALALYGDKTEKIIEGVTKRGFNLHPELLFNIMQTSLRMCRRNLTLKIEESTEGAWCKRYHEHGKNKQRCYRELASTNGGDEENAEMRGRDVDEAGELVDADLLDQFEAGLMAEEGAEVLTGEKRGIEDDGEFSPNKRARYDGGDEHAEGDSEED